MPILALWTCLASFPSVAVVGENDVETQRWFVRERMPFVVRNLRCNVPPLAALDSVAAFRDIDGVFVSRACAGAGSANETGFGRTTNFGRASRLLRAGVRGYFQALMDRAAAQQLDARCRPIGMLFDRNLTRCLGAREHSRLLRSYGWRALFFGTRGTGMPLHTDELLTHTWSLQVEGAKRFRFCPPAAITTSLIRERLANDGVTLNMSLFDGGDVRNSGSGDVGPIGGSQGSDDRGHSGRRRFLRACRGITARRGDFVYWPSDWWHETLNGDLYDRVDGRGTGCGPANSHPRAPLSISYSGMHVDDSVRYRFASDVLDATTDGRFDEKLSHAFIRCLGLSDVANNPDIDRKPS